MTTDTNLRINLENLYRFKAQAAKRRVTMKALFAAVCDMLEAETAKQVATKENDNDRLD